MRRLMYPQTRWKVGDVILSEEDKVQGTVIEIGYSAVNIQWTDGKVSCIGMRSNIAGRFRQVVNEVK